MPTLGMNVSMTLSTNKTRQSLTEFYKGIAVEDIRILPFAYLTDQGEKAYSLEDSKVFIFIGDVYDGSCPFDLIMTNDQDETVTLQQIDFIVVNASNLKEVRVKSAVDDKVGFKVYTG